MIIDFILIAQYKTHDEETLCYLDHILYRIDKIKIVFKVLHPVDKTTDEGYFNFLKFYVMTHYISCIQDFGTIDNFDMEYSEARYKYNVKDFYGRTNKWQGYENQICLHNTRQINMIAIEDMLFHRQTRYTAQADNEFRA